MSRPIATRPLLPTAGAAARPRSAERVALLALLVLAVSGAAAPLRAATATLNGDPLQISVFDDLSMEVNRNELQPGGGVAYDRQYFSRYYPFLRMSTLNGNFAQTAVYSGYFSNFTAGTNSSPDAATITSAVTCADNVAITQTITYVAGAQTFKHVWTVTNNGQTTYTGVSFLYGGDTFYNDSDLSGGFYDVATQMVYCAIPGVSGLMALYPDPTTPSSHYYESGYGNVWSALSGTADLADTVDPDYIDNGVGMQWNLSTLTRSGSGTLAPGDTFTVIAYEKWVASGAFAVTAPSSQTTAPGASIPLTFTVQNLQNFADTIDLTYLTSSGVQVSGPASVQIAAGGSATVQVTVDLTAVPDGTTALITLKAVSHTDTTVFNQSTTSLVVQVGFVPPTVVSVPLPGLPLSHGAQTIFCPLCPSTTAGVANLLAALTGRADSQAVGYAWDASLTPPGYVKLPAQPTGGLATTSGVFVAARVDLGLDFNGAPTALPCAITLKPGWNFIGIPPLDANGTTLTSHAFPGDFELLDNTGALVTTRGDFADILGTPGSGDPSTAEPFFFDGSAYHQVATMTTASGYWLFNNTTGTSPGADVTLRRVLVATVLTNAASGTLGAHLRTAGTAYRSHSTPPTPPASGNSDSGGGHGCGLGSGISTLGGLTLFAALAFRRRQRRV